MDKEMMELSDALCDAAKLVQKEVKKIVDKGDLTEKELDSLYKAACFMEKIEKTCVMDGESYGPRHYDMKMDAYGDWNGYSERRGRSPVTGRYISRGMDGMSGHSVEDRMIASLEHEMDNVTSEYDKKRIMDEIRNIRMGMMGQR